MLRSVSLQNAKRNPLRVDGEVMAKSIMGTNQNGGATISIRRPLQPQGHKTWAKAGAPIRSFGSLPCTRSFARTKSAMTFLTGAQHHPITLPTGPRDMGERQADASLDEMTRRYWRRSERKRPANFSEVRQSDRYLAFYTSPERTAPLRNRKSPNCGPTAIRPWLSIDLDSAAGTGAFLQSFRRRISLAPKIVVDFLRYFRSCSGCRPERRRNASARV